MATVVFVCPHGALKSRVAAALFNATAPPGWRATSAGLQPQAEVSVHAAPMLAGSSALDVLDLGAPVAHGGLSLAERVIAIDCVIDGAAAWWLSHTEPGEAMREELAGLVTGLIEEIGR